MVVLVVALVEVGCSVVEPVVGWVAHIVLVLVLEPVVVVRTAVVEAASVVAETAHIEAEQTADVAVARTAVVAE